MRAAFRLAALLRCTVGELEQRMSSHEFGLWQAYLVEEPVTPDVTLQLWATLMAAISNGPMRKKDKSAWKVADFLRERWRKPDPRKDPKNMTPGATAGALRGAFKHLRPQRKKAEE